MKSRRVDPAPGPGEGVRRRIQADPGRSAGSAYGHAFAPSAACQNGTVRVAFEAELWIWDARRNDSWTFVSLPPAASVEIRELVDGMAARGFGSVRVRATIGASTWLTSIFPDTTRGTYTLPIKKAIRRTEALSAGDVTTVTVETVDLDTDRPEATDDRPDAR